MQTNQPCKHKAEVGRGRKFNFHIQKFAVSKKRETEILARRNAGSFATILL